MADKNQRARRIARRRQRVYEEVPGITLGRPPTKEESNHVERYVHVAHGLAPPSVTAVLDTLTQRGTRYGDFTDNASISQEIKDIVEKSPGWRRATKVQREGLTMIIQKIARICNGDPAYADNWHDIQGYAKLVEDRLS